MRRQRAVLDRNVERLIWSWTFDVGRWVFDVFFQFFNWLLEKALFPKPRVLSSQFQERRMRPAFDNPSTLQHENLLRPQNRREPMGDHKTSPMRHQILERFLDQPLRR